MTENNNRPDDVLRAFLTRGQAAQAAVDRVIREDATERREKDRGPAARSKRRPA